MRGDFQPEKGHRFYLTHTGGKIRREIIILHTSLNVLTDFHIWPFRSLGTIHTPPFPSPIVGVPIFTFIFDGETSEASQFTAAVHIDRSVMFKSSTRSRWKVNKCSAFSVPIAVAGERYRSAACKRRVSCTFHTRRRKRIAF